MTSRPAFNLFELPQRGWPASPFLTAMTEYLATFSGTESDGVTGKSSQPASTLTAAEFALAAERLADAAADLPEDPAEIAQDEWHLGRQVIISLLQQHLLMDGQPGFRTVLSAGMTQKQVAAVDRVQTECSRVLRLWLVYRPELVDEIPSEVTEFVLTFRIPWWAYLRAMWNLLWSCVRHPLSETTIDLSTGRVLYHT